MRPPRIFWAFTRYWQLRPAMARHWWTALSQATYSTPVSWRHTLQYHNSGTLGDRHALIHKTCSPAEVVDVVEALVHEGCLTRQQGNDLEQAILACVTAHGTWR
jgi:hypothetical protein